MSRLIVKNLPEHTTKEKLQQIFSEKGVITDIQLKYTKDGKFRRFAFVGFQKPEMAEAAKESLNKCFINTSQIQIETCAALGDPNKPRPWSKYAPENNKVVLKGKNNEKNGKIKLKQSEKQKIKDPKVLELLKNHKNDKLFSEFLELNVPGTVADKHMSEDESDTDSKTKKCEGSKDETVLKQDDILANRDISDSEYLKLKTGVNLKLEDNTKQTEGHPVQKWSTDLYTIKLSGLNLKVKKSEIKQFLAPHKPFTIRRARRIKGVAYCGFKSEVDMKAAINKNRTFLNGKRIFVKRVRCAVVRPSEVTERKWKAQTMNIEETIAESGRIFIRNLPYSAGEDEVKDLFQKFGPVAEFIFPINDATRMPVGYAIVTYLIPEHACNAYNALDGTIFQGRMLHLIPGLSSKKNNEMGDSIGESFKNKKLIKEKAKSDSSVNWNTFFVGENALADAMAATYNTSKEKVLDDKGGGAAVRLALGETQIISKIKEFLEENDVRLEAFENMSPYARSKRVILVKNLPYGTKAEEVREKFAPFGVLKRVVMPPTGVAALVEFIEPYEAKKAFRRLSYSKFKHVPLYLEWAPKKVFKKDEEDAPDKELEIEEIKEKAVKPETVTSETGNAETVQEHIPVEGATIFVKNLNFSTGDEALRGHFSPCGTIVSAKVALKRNPHEPEKKLSMGYGFVEFTDKESADKALKILQFSSLDNHRIELKRSCRTVAPAPMSGRKTSSTKGPSSTKILVRNVPFQATQKEITDLFKVFGEVKSVRLPKKMVGTGSHRGFCFVEFNTKQDAKRALSVLSQSTHLYGRRLVLEWAASDDDVATLRKKTAEQFKKGSVEKNKNVTIEEESEEE